ncbi:MAG: hypothetical protein EAZ92_06570 [Candidatus Kapaibacterium sp.]|nr:MAG: hypothetical protein EAZ92_06570 [Candidatus Kapabacteria bacterium]
MVRKSGFGTDFESSAIISQKLRIFVRRKNTCFYDFFACKRAFVRFEALSFLKEAIASFQNTLLHLLKKCFIFGQIS